MTPQRAADLLANEEPDPQQGMCGRCMTVAPLYREPEHLFDNEPAEAVCAYCVRRIAGRRSPTSNRAQIALDL
jgi:hypothetical protein